MKISISIHAPHARSDGSWAATKMEQKIFQSTLLMRGATYNIVNGGVCNNISIHAPHARSDTIGVCASRLIIISIHAPHARSDTKQTEETVRAFIISIHAPHARSDQSRAAASAVSMNFNPRSSCEERRLPRKKWISAAVFQSTLLMRGATRWAVTASVASEYFNPRSSCEERRVWCREGVARNYFNPRSSCEERHSQCPVYIDEAVFQSTLLMRGATWVKHGMPLTQKISIHAPHARSDPYPEALWYPPYISIHAPHARSDTVQKTLNHCRSISIHAPHARSDAGIPITAITDVISIHAPHARSD